MNESDGVLDDEADKVFDRDSSIVPSVEMDTESDIDSMPEVDIVSSAVFVSVPLSEAET